MPERVPISVLDLVAVSEGHTVDDALAASMSAVRLADGLGYERYWFAEHHNTELLGSSATQVLIGRAASLTSRIRIGSGGVMLPNHAPLLVAEQYGTLERFFPGRIDLGLGRAPGTDPVTARSLGRHSADPGTFARDVVELAEWFGPAGRSSSSGIAAGVARGTRVPLLMLGSSTAGAEVAGLLGLPFAFASHFAPAQLAEAAHVYRSSFDASAPTAQAERPHLIVGALALAAPTDDEAELEFTSTRRRALDKRTGDRRRIQPPAPLGPAEVALGDAGLGLHAVGSSERVVARLDDLVAATGADELMLATYAHDPAVRERSLELVARAWHGDGA